ncbi:MAG: SUMF1/EgtB/PvdO family nonheme iron enzyme [bacterium]|nr:SUMF1/EgtB/PvdO family nonheme iron enzyme [bacterium]
MLKRSLVLVLVALAFAVGRSGAVPIPVTPDPVAEAAVVVAATRDPGFRLIVHHRNPTESLTREQVAELFLLAGQTWADEKPVEPVEQAPETEIHAAFSRFVHAESASSVHGWQEKAVAARRDGLLVREGDEAVIQWVRFHTAAIGYVSPGAVPADGVKVVKITDEDEDDEDDKPDRISLVLDASGSMKARINGRPKLEIARDVLREVLADWDPKISLGMVAFGHRDGTCQDIETLVPTDRGGASPVIAAVEQIQAKGATPLTQAVIQAAEDVASEGETARVVLVSDGEESCGRNPCEIHEAMESRGVGFTTYVVGFDILRNAKAQSQLRCLAQKSGGTFQLAWDAKSLRKALKIALARAAGLEMVEEVTQLATEDEDERELDLRLEYVAAGEIGASRSPKDRQRGKSRQMLRVRDDFWITDTEITQGDWQLLMGANPSYFRSCGEECPVERVNMFDAMLFANELSKHQERRACYRLAGCQGTPGVGCPEDAPSCDGGFFCGFVAPVDGCDGYRLPTESEWRYAAQGDRETAFWWGDELTPEDARCAGNSRDREIGTEEARGMPANAYGLHEVHGNVAEWTRSTPPAMYLLEGPDGDQRPSAPESFFQDRSISWEPRKQESVAGGSWRSSPEMCQASGSLELPPAKRSSQVGFRLVTSARR